MNWIEGGRRETIGVITACHLFTSIHSFSLHHLLLIRFSIPFSWTLLETPDHHFNMTNSKLNFNFKERKSQVSSKILGHTNSLFFFHSFLSSCLSAFQSFFQATFPKYNVNSEHVFHGIFMTWGREKEREDPYWIHIHKPPFSSSNIIFSHPSLQLSLIVLLWTFCSSLSLFIPFSLYSLSLYLRKYFSPSLKLFHVTFLMIWRGLRMMRSSN